MMLKLKNGIEVMDSFKDLLSGLHFLRMFRTDWAKLIALALILGAFLLLSSWVTTVHLIITCVSTTIVMYLILDSGNKRHAVTKNAEVEKYKLLYFEEEKKHKDKTLFEGDES